MTSLDAELVARVWDEFLPPRYRVDAELVLFNTLESGLLIHEASRVQDDGFVIVKSSALGRVYGETADPVAHISAFAFSHPDVGRSLLIEARTALANLGYKTWQFGGDWRHFFPGVPSECGPLTSLLVE